MVGLRRPTRVTDRSPGWLRASLSGLTTRGRSFLAAGVAAGICAFALGQRDLLRIGVLLIALPLGAALVIGRAQFRLSLVRTITPTRVVAGTVARVRLELENLTRGVTKVLLAEDRVPYTLGPSPRFVVARLPGGRRAAVTYALRPQLRGRYDVGPLRLQLTDPFGLCEATRAFTATDPLIVVPQTWPLAGAPAGGQWGGSGEAVHGTAAASGEHDIAIREYRYGDDLRRVHWRSTARRGELMVRRDEQPRQMRATVLLDSRLEAHRGEGPASSFEWAVSAAASVAVHLSGLRYGVRLLIDDSPAAWTSPSGTSGTGALLDRLAMARLERGGGLTAATAALQRSHGDGLVVAVLGDVDDDVAGALAGARRPGTSAVALLLRVPHWALLAPEVAAEMDARRQRASAILRTSGWAVTEAGPQDAVPPTWHRAVAAGSPAAAFTPAGAGR
jgi:uncharacterized protein (DUF58 family)